eukprot:12786631-Alexandrium_andersonii.AAC.1
MTHCPPDHYAAAPAPLLPCSASWRQRRPCGPQGSAAPSRRPHHRRLRPASTPPASRRARPGPATWPR